MSNITVRTEQGNSIPVSVKDVTVQRQVWEWDCVDCGERIESTSNPVTMQLHHVTQDGEMLVEKDSPFVCASCYENRIVEEEKRKAIEAAKATWGWAGAEVVEVDAKLVGDISASGEWIKVPRVDKIVLETKHGTRIVLRPGQEYNFVTEGNDMWIDFEETEIDDARQ